MQNKLVESKSTSNEIATVIIANKGKEGDNYQQYAFDQHLNQHLEKLKVVNSSENKIDTSQENKIELMTKYNIFETTKLEHDNSKEKNEHEDTDLNSITSAWNKIEISPDMVLITNLHSQPTYSDTTQVDFAKSQGFDDEAISLIFSSRIENEVLNESIYSEAAINHENLSKSIISKLKRSSTEIVNTDFDSLNTKAEGITNSINIFKNSIRNIFMCSATEEIKQIHEKFITEATNYKMGDPNQISELPLNSSFINNDYLKNELQRIYKTSNDTHILNNRVHQDCIENTGNQLSNKIGIAIGKQLINEVNNGSWEVQLQLNPRELGRIDINLKLHEHRMDAQFFVANIYTQTLLQDGMAKLKETVGFSGIELASTWVVSANLSQQQHNPREPRDQQSKLTSINEIDKLQEFRNTKDDLLQPFSKRNIHKKTIVDLYI